MSSPAQPRIGSVEAERVYAYLRILGDPGDTVVTATHRYLAKHYYEWPPELGDEAWRARVNGMRILTELGYITRSHPRSRSITILK